MPIAASPIELATTHCTTLLTPCAHTKGIAGKMAPSENRQKDTPAAVHGFPPSSAGSRPSSSRVKVSSALSLSRIICEATLPWIATQRALALEHAVAALEEAFTKYGLPEIVNTDQGRPCGRPCS